MCLGRFGSLYDQLRDTSRMSTSFVLVYMLRRMILGASIVFLYSYPAFQAIIQVLTSMTVLSYLAYQCHFTSLLVYFQEVVNESTLLLLSLNLFSLLSNSYDESNLWIREGQGMVMNYATMGCIGVNLLTFGYQFC